MDIRPMTDLEEKMYKELMAEREKLRVLAKMYLGLWWDVYGDNEDTARAKLRELGIEVE